MSPPGYSSAQGREQVAPSSRAFSTRAPGTLILSSSCCTRADGICQTGDWNRKTSENAGLRPRRLRTGTLREASSSAELSSRLGDGITYVSPGEYGHCLMSRSKSIPKSSPKVWSQSGEALRMRLTQTSLAAASTRTMFPKFKHHDTTVLRKRSLVTG